ncbi:MAG: D-alanyl-D-alanine carboxypeptidase/D-alanyl-D-alanine-endopeptidase [Gemmatimonadales bacterium]|nr:D-alanyl-D-alanine carboxypeptidase/D-alanyl-D-alanine-endopeptidase [Gemmatimonadales bacterium]MDQ3427498.1 D-alanyl-D-alanine carboxypeptidase/D-alanyl-D-alanine-endopeptidase [Gemmatimonadota bacterium]
MARRLLWTMVVACSLDCAASPGLLPAQELSPRERVEVEAWFRRAAARTPGGEWGIAVGTMDGRILWSVSPELELIPASTAKLFTTGFSRARLGGGARIVTRIVGDGRLDPATGHWQGAWALELGGDPTLERSGRSGPTLGELARQLRDRGIRVLEGPLALTSRSGPAASRYPSVWSAGYMGQLYAPPVGPATLHENTVSLTFRPGREVGMTPTLVSAYPDGVARMVRVAATTVSGTRRRLSLRSDPDGGWTLLGVLGIERRTAGLSAVAHDPSRLMVSAWAAALERAGIVWVNPGGPAALAPRSAAILAQVSSAPLDSVALEVNRRSLNIGAELLLQWGAGSQTTGPELVTRHVREVVGPLARVRLVDGSGLSELNRMSPLTQVLYLARYPQLPGNQRFPLLLPANGTGTLRRLRQGMGRGVVHAKTGTLDRVATLAGYLGRPDGVLVVSLMYNGGRTSAARAAEWELFRLLGGEGVDLGGMLVTHMGGATVKSEP